MGLLVFYCFLRQLAGLFFHFNGVQISSPIKVGAHCAHSLLREQVLVSSETSVPSACGLLLFKVHGAVIDFKIFGNRHLYESLISIFSDE